MATNAQEILDQTKLIYLVSDRMPTAEDRQRVLKLGAALIHLGPGELVEHYDSWQVHHREHVDEPFIGSLVRSSVKLDTEADRDLDILEGGLDLGFDTGGIPPEVVLDNTDLLARTIANHPELSADSIKAKDLATLVLAITIEHPLKEKELFEEREFYLNGDIEDPIFRQQVYEKFETRNDKLADEMEELYGGGDPLFELEKEYVRDSEEDIEERRAELMLDWMDPEYEQAVKSRWFYEDKFDDLIGVVTTPQAAQQLAKESQQFGFELNEKYLTC